MWCMLEGEGARCVEGVGSAVTQAGDGNGEEVGEEDGGEDEGEWEEVESDEKEENEEVVDEPGQIWEDGDVMK